MDLVGHYRRGNQKSRTPSLTAPTAFKAGLYPVQIGFLKTVKHSFKFHFFKLQLRGIVPIARTDPIVMGYYVLSASSLLWNLRYGSTSTSTLITWIDPFIAQSQLGFFIFPCFFTGVTPPPIKRLISTNIS
jgi:hypothetical protein